MDVTCSLTDGVFSWRTGSPRWRTIIGGNGGTVLAYRPTEGPLRGLEEETP
jgi:hypothetical protein